MNFYCQLDYRHVPYPSPTSPNGNIADNGCGVCIAPDDVDGFYNEILSCYENREKLLEMGKNGRSYVTTHLTKEIGTGKWVELLKSVVNEEDNTKSKVTVEA